MVIPIGNPESYSAHFEGETGVLRQNDSLFSAVSIEYSVDYLGPTSNMPKKSFSIETIKKGVGRFVSKMTVKEAPALQGHAQSQPNTLAWQIFEETDLQ